MTTFKNPKTCRDCSETFEASRTDSTVRCPSCRRDRRERVSPAAAEANAARVAVVKSRGYAARRAGDTAAYEAALAELTALRAQGLPG